MTAEELNAIVESKDFPEFVRVCEARQNRRIAAMADAIAAEPGVRLVLMTGGSSAGKTTSAKRLCTQLGADGIPVEYVSTDDFFVGNALNPRDENGEFDYETIECVDRPLLSERLGALLEGREIPRHRFDFIAHEPYDADETMRLDKDGVVILEGLHALNPELLPGLGVKTFGVFVEPKPDAEFAGSLSLSSRDVRLLRRIVRDGQYRKISAGETLKMWPKVTAGEEKWILPFRHLANAQFNSFLDYELSILKPFAQGHLEKERIKNPDDAKVAQLLETLDGIAAASPVVVPGDSILRETIGGSLLEY